MVSVSVLVSSCGLSWSRSAKSRGKSLSYHICATFKLLAYFKENIYFDHTKLKNKLIYDLLFKMRQTIVQKQAGRAMFTFGKFSLSSWLIKELLFKSYWPLYFITVFYLLIFFRRLLPFCKRWSSRMVSTYTKIVRIDILQCNLTYKLVEFTSLK
jgi:hypothetical protein